MKLMAELMVEITCRKPALQYLSDHQLVLLATTKTDQILFDRLQSFSQHQLSTNDHVLSLTMIKQLIADLQSLSFTMRLWGDIVIDEYHGALFLRYAQYLKHDLQLSVQDALDNLNHELLTDEDRFMGG